MSSLSASSRHDPTIDRLCKYPVTRTCCQDLEDSHVPPRDEDPKTIPKRVDRITHFIVISRERVFFSPMGQA